MDNRIIPAIVKITLLLIIPNKNIGTVDGVKYKRFNV
jgi:hypothetical protein